MFIKKTNNSQPNHLNAKTQLFERGIAVQELISRKPGFLIRWGVQIFSIILVLIMMATWFIKYPDIVSAKGKLVSINPPRAIISKSEGQLIRLILREGESVKKDDILGYMESTIDYKNVLQLLRLFHSFQNSAANGNFEKLYNIPDYSFIISQKNLGELQKPFETFFLNYITYKNHFGKKKNPTQKLNEGNEVTASDDNTEMQKLIFAQSLSTVIYEFEEWKKKYIVVSPATGRIAFSGLAQEHQQVHVNEVICYVNPDNSEYYVELSIPQFNLGKVRIHQEVLLKFPSYPYQEYGILYGNIDFISTIPTDSGYSARIKLPVGLVTNYDTKIQYREGLIAQGEIITQDMRLLERFYYNIIKQIKK